VVVEDRGEQPTARKAAGGAATTTLAVGVKIKEISGRVMYLSESLLCALVCTFFRFGVGMRHSIWKAVQLVHGTPRLAASQRTCTG
jgi:hypothetical protein